MHRIAAGTRPKDRSEKGSQQQQQQHSVGSSIRQDSSSGSGSTSSSKRADDFDCDFFKDFYYSQGDYR